jgi:hypothetical protein
MFTYSYILPSFLALYHHFLLAFFPFKQSSFRNKRYFYDNYCKNTINLNFVINTFCRLNIAAILANIQRLITLALGAMLIKVLLNTA